MSDQLTLLRKPVRSKRRREKRVLAVVGDSQVGLWVVRSLGRYGLNVHAVCKTSNGLSAYSRYADGAWSLSCPSHSPRFAQQIIQLARQLDVGSVMTIAESYHKALMKVRDELEPDIHLFSPADECFEKAVDKGYMNELCLDLGVPVAKGATLDQFLSGRNGLRYPLVLRTRNLNDRSVKRAPWKAAYADGNPALEKLARDVRGAESNVVVQEYHSGVEDHVQVLMHDGEPFMVGEYVGEHHMPLAGGVTVRRVSCRHPQVIRDCIKLLKALEWDGIAGVQFHYDPATDDYIFLEINPRFIGGLPTVIMAGFDAPLLLWQSHFEPDNMQRTRYRLGMRTRILGGDANWALGMIRRDPLPPDQQHVSRIRSVGSFLWNSLPWTRDDAWLVGDPKPAVVDWINMVRRLGDKSTDILGSQEKQIAT